MTTVSYALGQLPSAEKSGGRCRARDVGAATSHNIYGLPHRFVATTDCRITNGILLLTVGPGATTPTLTLSARAATSLESAASTYDDTSTYDDDSVYTDDVWNYAWAVMGSIVIDSTTATALLTGVRLVRVDEEVVTIRLVIPAIGDAFVTLRRGEPMARIQHGSTGGTPVVVARRVRMTASPSPVGTSFLNRVAEAAPSVDNTLRFVAAVTPGATVNAGAFSVSVPSVGSADFGAGVGVPAAVQELTAPGDLHAQFFDASRLRLALVAA